MKCSECIEDIHPERLKVQPNVKTCSTECSKKRSAKRMAESSKKRHEATNYQAAKTWAKKNRKGGPIGRPRKDQPKESSPLSS